VELARAGWSFDDIAAELGYASRSGAWQAVQKALAAHEGEQVADYRMLELARLDELQSAVWDKAVAGDVAAVSAVLRIVERRMRLMGLDRLAVNQGSERGGRGSRQDDAFWEHIRTAHGLWADCQCTEFGSRAEVPRAASAL
jgi:hypothetical protein